GQSYAGSDSVSAGGTLTSTGVETQFLNSPPTLPFPIDQQYTFQADVGDTIFFSINGASTVSGNGSISLAFDIEFASITGQQATFALTFTPSSPITYGTPLTAAQLDAVATDPTTGVQLNPGDGDFTYTDNGTPITAGTILHAGNNLITATYNTTDPNYTSGGPIQK